MSLDKGIEHGKERRSEHRHHCPPGCPACMASRSRKHERAAPVIEEDDTQGARVRARPFPIYGGRRSPVHRERRGKGV